MSMPATEFFSADMVRALPEDGKRYETVYGELFVTPAPRQPHQAIRRELFLALGNYLKFERLGGLFSSHADISWGPDILVQPDLFVADNDEIGPSEGWTEIQTLHLAIEILSPSTLRTDRFTKRRLYQEHQVATYWIVDLDSTNGIEVNGRSVKRAKLEPGDSFTVGETVVTFSTERE